MGVVGEGDGAGDRCLGWGRGTLVLRVEGEDASLLKVPPKGLLNTYFMLVASLGALQAVAGFILTPVQEEIYYHHPHFTGEATEEQ